jgi:NADH-quinone oxidoreductase subunit M
MNFPILTVVTFLPLVGAVLILAAPTWWKDDQELVKIDFVLSLFIWGRFDPASPEFQMVEHADWIPSFNIAYHMGVDGISLFFILLTTFLTPLCVLASWESVQVRVKEYMVSFLVMETLMVGTFC